MSKFRGGKSSATTLAPESLSPYSDQTHSELDKLSAYSAPHSDDKMMVYDLDQEGLGSYAAPIQEPNKLTSYEITEQEQALSSVANNLAAYSNPELPQANGMPSTDLEAYREPEKPLTYSTPEDTYLETYNAPSSKQNELGSYSDQAQKHNRLTPYIEQEQASTLNPYNDQDASQGGLHSYSDSTQHPNPLGTYATIGQEEMNNAVVQTQSTSKEPRPKSALMANMRAAVDKIKGSSPIKNGKYDPKCVPVRLRDHFFADNYLLEIGQEKFNLPINGANGRPLIGADGKPKMREVNIPKLTDKERAERKVSYDKTTGLLMKDNSKASTIGQKAKGIQDLQSFVMTKPDGKDAGGADKKVGDIFLFNHYDLLATENRMISHGAVAGERPAEMAGALKIVDGKIEGITNYSGHYAPSDLDMYRFINTLNENMPGAISEHCLVKLEGRASSPNVIDFMKAMEKTESNGKTRHENLLEARIKQHNSRPLATDPLSKASELEEAPMPLPGGLARQHTSTDDDIAKVAEEKIRAEHNEGLTTKSRTHTMVAAMKAFATVASKNTVAPRSGMVGGHQKAGSLDR